MAEQSTAIAAGLLGVDNVRTTSLPSLAISAGFVHPNDPTPARPVSREDLLGRLETVQMQASLIEEGFGHLTGTQLAPYVENAEWFDFGPVPVDGLTRACADAAPFREEDMVRPPYPVSAFRFRQAGPDGTFGSDVVLLVLDLNDRAALPTGIMSKGNPEMKGTVVILFGCTLAHTVISSIAFATGPLIASASMKDERRDMAAASISIWEALWLILNTKNIQKIVEEPSPKLNKARAKVGKSPLKRVTRVNATQYMRALAETERVENLAASGNDSSNTSSRAMHLRRGHVRHYHGGHWTSAQGRKRWIMPMIINADKDTETVQREKYQVKS